MYRFSVQFIQVQLHHVTPVRTPQLSFQMLIIGGILHITH